MLKNMNISLVFWLLLSFSGPSAKGGSGVVSDCDDASVQEASRRCFKDFEEQVETFKKHEGNIFFGGVDVEVVRSMCSQLTASTGCFGKSMKDKCSKKSSWRTLDEFKRNFVALCSRKHLFEDYAMVQHCFWEARRTSLNCYQSFIHQSGYGTTGMPKDENSHHYHHHYKHFHHHQNNHHHHHSHRDTKDEYNVEMVLSGASDDDDDDDDDYIRIQDKEKCRLLKRLKSCVHYSLRFCGQKSYDLSNDLVTVSVSAPQISFCPVHSNQRQSVLSDEKDSLISNDSLTVGKKESPETHVDGVNLKYILDNKARQQQQQQGRSFVLSSAVSRHESCFCKIAITFLYFVIVNCYHNIF